MDRDAASNKNRDVALDKPAQGLSDDSLIHALQVAVVVHKADDTSITSFNDKALELLDLTEDQMLGRTAMDPRWKFIHEDGSDMPAEDYPVNQVVRTNRPLRNMVVGICRPVKDDLVWVLVNADPVYGKDAILEVLVSFVDITQRKHADDALHRYEDIVSASSDIMAMLGKDFVYLTVNRRYAEALNKKPEEITGRSPGELFGKEFFEKTIKPNGMRCLEGSTVHYQVWVDFPAHGRRFMDVHYYPHRDRSGQVAGIIVVGRDMTEQKTYQDELIKAKEEAENATALKDRFVSLVSHDLQTPLATLTGFLHLLQKETDDHLPPKLKDVLEASIESGERMGLLIKDILGLSRLKGGKIAPQRRFMDASILVKATLATSSHAATRKGIRLHNAVPRHSRIYADPALLGEALQNLVSNAVKFCAGGDTVTVSFARKDNAVLLSVKDTGPGIPQAIKERLFEYGKGKTTVGTEGERGTGLGLPLARELITAHDGDLAMAEEGEEGSRFDITLPMARPRVLMVDDDRAFRLLQSYALRDLDIDLAEAADGKEALEHMRRTPPHVVVADIEMPGMDGLELLARMQSEPETRAIPVIIVSGEHGMEVRDRVFALGGQDFVPKSSVEVELIPRLRRFIS